MGESNAFLGRGWSFPPRIDPVTGRFRTAEAEEDIRQAIYIILMTKRGERAMMPDFGCNIHDFVFALPDSASLTMMRHEIVTALLEWEPRVMDVAVNFDQTKIGDGILTIDVGYVVRATNSAQNLVFPYYLYEGVGQDFD
jgi:phage baseplate assembly protein W